MSRLNFFFSVPGCASICSVVRGVLHSGWPGGMGGSCMMSPVIMTLYFPNAALGLMVLYGRPSSLLLSTAALEAEARWLQFRIPISSISRVLMKGWR